MLPPLAWVTITIWYNNCKVKYFWVLNEQPRVEPRISGFELRRLLYHWANSSLTLLKKSRFEPRISGFEFDRSTIELTCHFSISLFVCLKIERMCSDFWQLGWMILRTCTIKSCHFLKSRQCLKWKPNTNVQILDTLCVWINNWALFQFQTCSDFGVWISDTHHTLKNHGSDLNDVMLIWYLKIYFD